MKKYIMGCLQANFGVQDTWIKHLNEGVISKKKKTFFPSEF